MNYYLPFTANPSFLLFDVLVAHRLLSRSGFLPSGLLLLLSLSFFNSSLLLSLSNLRLLSLLSLNLSPRLRTSTPNNFHDPPLPLFSVNFSHGTFLVLPPVKDGPGDFPWVFLVFVKLFGFA